MTSSSRAVGSGWISLASASSRLVSPAIAEGTTTSWCPSPAKRATRRATSRIRSGLPIEVPPYFWTISDTGGESEKRGYSIVAHREKTHEDRPAPPDTRLDRPRLRRGAHAFRVAPGRQAGGKRGESGVREPGRPRDEHPPAAPAALHPSA